MGLNMFLTVLCPLVFPRENNIVYRIQDVIFIYYIYICMYIYIYIYIYIYMCIHLYSYSDESRFIFISSGLRTTPLPVLRKNCGLAGSLVITGLRAGGAGVAVPVVVVSNYRPKYRTQSIADATFTYYPVAEIYENAQGRRTDVMFSWANTPTAGKNLTLL